MTPINFEEATHLLAKDQPEYLPLPVHIGTDGCVTSCWGMTIMDRLRVLWSGRLRLQVLAFGRPLQPQRPDVVKPELRCHGTTS